MGLRYTSPPTGVFRSGQTGQTVNLVALPSQVRILPRPIPLQPREAAGFLAVVRRPPAFEKPLLGLPKVVHLVP